MKRGTCEFCGRENVEIDDEHVWPVWMGDALLSQMNAPQLRIARGDKTLFLSDDTISALNITVKCACKTRCNGDWMHKLEDKVIPFLKPMLLSGQNTPLNDERQALLATWAVKTAMVHEFTDKSAMYFRREERQHVKTWFQPPDNVWIWIGHSLTTPQAHSNPIYQRTKELLPRVVCYALTFTAGHFLMQIFAYRSTERQGGKRFRVNPGVLGNGLIPLWPRSDRTVVLWPPPVAFSDDSLIALEQRFFGEVVVDGLIPYIPRQSKKRNGPTEP